MKLWKESYGNPFWELFYRWHDGRCRTRGHKPYWETRCGEPHWSCHRGCGPVFQLGEPFGPPKASRSKNPFCRLFGCNWGHRQVISSYETRFSCTRVLCKKTKRIVSSRAAMRVNGGSS